VGVDNPHGLRHDVAGTARREWRGTAAHCHPDPDHIRGVMLAYIVALSFIGGAVPVALHVARGAAGDSDWRLYNLAAACVLEAGY